MSKEGKLNLNELSVESFRTTRGKKVKGGTVAHAQIGSVVCTHITNCPIIISIQICENYSNNG